MAEPPEDASEGDGEGERGLYKMGTIARITSFSPALLRAWERRHALLEPARGPGGHRLYTTDDLAVLTQVRALVDAGRSIGEIAAIGRAALLARPGAAAAGASGGGPRGQGTGGAAGASGGPRSGGAGAAIARGAGSNTPSLDFSRIAAAAAVARTGAGAAAATGTDVLARLAGEVVRGACALDGPAIARALDEAFATQSAEVAVHGVVERAAIEIGRLWAEGACTVAGEHLASCIFMQRLLRILDDGRVTSPAAPLAITVCLPDEHHEVGALVIALHMHRAGVRVAHLGPNLPIEDLARAVDVLRPRAALISVSREEVLERHLPRLRDAIARRAAATRFVVGGAGAGADRRGVIEAAGGVLWTRERSICGLGVVFGAPTAVTPPAPGERGGPGRGSPRPGRSEKAR